MQSFREELKSVRQAFKKIQSEINCDPNLSQEGKSKKLSEVREDFDSKISDLNKRYNEEHDKSVTRLKGLLEPKKKSSFRENIKLKASKGDVAQFIADDLETAMATLEGLSEIQNSVDRSVFINSVSHLPDDELSKLAKTHFNKGDIQKLSWLQDLHTFRGNKLGVDLIESYKRQYMEKILTPEQKKIKTRLQELEGEKMVFERALSLADKDSSHPDFEKLMFLESQDEVSK